MKTPKTITIENVEYKLVPVAKEEKEFPQDGDTYWYVLSDGDVNNLIWKENYYNEDHLAFGNCFKTKEKAEAHRDRIQSLKELTSLEVEPIIVNGEVLISLRVPKKYRDAWSKLEESSNE